jgi:5'(3')-deoxyribonucleotidase
MINTVFLDMDGVLVNFLGGLHEALGIPYSYENYPYEKGKWNMLTDIKGFDDIPATFEQCDDCCTTNFWRHLEWMPDGLDIFETIRHHFKPEQIYLLTTPMPNVESASGKMMWVKSNTLGYIKCTIITQAPKHLLARPDTLLIDDKDENVDGFREAGGKALLVPRPWNRAHLQADRTVEVVREFLERIE